MNVLGFLTVMENPQPYWARGYPIDSMGQVLVLTGLPDSYNLALRYELPKNVMLIGPRLRVEPVASGNSPSVAVNDVPHYSLFKNTGLEEDTNTGAASGEGYNGHVDSQRDKISEGTAFAANAIQASSDNGLETAIFDVGQLNGVSELEESIAEAESIVNPEDVVFDKCSKNIHRPSLKDKYTQTLLAVNDSEPIVSSKSEKEAPRRKTRLRNWFMWIVVFLFGFGMGIVTFNTSNQLQKKCSLLQENPMLQTLRENESREREQASLGDPEEEKKVHRILDTIDHALGWREPEH